MEELEDERVGSSSSSERRRRRRGRRKSVMKTSSALRTLCNKITFTFALLNIIVLANQQPSQAFNVEPQASVVQQGPQGSYFGYSVSQHRDQGANWLLVGAPRAQTNQPRTVQAGAVYRCSPNQAQACQQINFDPNGSGMIQLGKELAQQDDKSRQWFGASLASAQDNGSIVACAPRYVYHSTNLKRRDPVGTCWVSRGSFSGFLEYSPCRLNENWGHVRMGSCQAGFSSAISKDGSRLFMGAPGSRVWQGQVFAHNLRTDLQNATSDSNPHSEDDSYLGYSIALGKFSQTGQASGDDLAIGIPRGHDLQGKVMLADREMRTMKNLTGEQIGAYFGYSLASADLNGDGLDDLLVGAPLYYNQTISHKEAHFERGRVYVYLQTPRHEFQLVAKWDGSRNRARFGTSLANCGDLNRDGVQDVAVGAPNDGPSGHGAVYIFLGRRNINAGNLHSDGWQPDQVIYAEQVRGEGNQLRSFGWSLSGGMDLDKNEYPDLLVGDYQSDRAVLMRTRPVLNVTASLTFSPEYFNLDERNCLLPNNRSQVPCISIQYCIKYTGQQVDSRLPLLIDIKLDTDNQKGAPRLFFVDNELKSEDQLTQMYDRNVEKCKSFKAYIHRMVRDKLTPLKVEVEYNLASDQQPELLDSQGLVRLRPILNKQPGSSQTNKLAKVTSIQRNCGYDNVCVPDLKLTMTSNLDQYTIGTNERLVLDVTVKNQGEDAYESMFYLTMPMTINYITTANKTRGDQPTCYGAKPDQAGVNVLACDLGNPQPRNDQLKFSVVMEPARGNHTDADFTFVGVVNSTNPEQDDRARENNNVAIGIPIKVEVNLVLSGKSSPALIEHNSTRRSLELSSRGLQRLEPQVETDLGPEVIHTYQLQNKGPSTINDIALTILWPTKTEDGENYLLYLVDEPITTGRVRCKPPAEGSINPMKLKYLRGDSVQPSSLNSSLARFKRQVQENLVREDTTTTSVDNSIVQQLYTVTCGPNQCNRFECNVLDLGHNDIATVKIRSRLYEDTLARPSRLLQTEKDFDISSRLVAQVKSLPYSVSSLAMPPYHTKVETQVRRLDLTVQDLLPWWLILVAILLGLLLFALLACFLRYLGFFARKRPPKGAEREPLTPTIWNDYQYTPGDTAL